ncbi:MAG: helix-turn-helix transcriptional regulator [Candidatus Tectomicrobia bacterium]|nr:helix-turn-helix transcriptional regulator [Candidatus Tectomicrobia bacterium]
MSSIFKHRTRLGLTRKELGWRAGIGRSDIGHFERGILKPSAAQLEKLAAVFEVDVKELIPAYFPKSRSEGDYRALEEELQHCRSENERLRTQNERLQSENTDLMTLLTKRPFSGVLNGSRQQDKEIAKDLVSLMKITHPDRHAGHALAVELTKAIVALKEKYGVRKTSA